MPRTSMDYFIAIAAGLVVAYFAAFLGDSFAQHYPVSYLNPAEKDTGPLFILGVSGVIAVGAPILAWAHYAQSGKTDMLLVVVTMAGVVSSAFFVGYFLAPFTMGIWVPFGWLAYPSAFWLVLSMSPMALVIRDACSYEHAQSAADRKRLMSEFTPADIS